MERNPFPGDGLLDDDLVTDEILELRSLYFDYLGGEIATFRSLLARRALEEIRELGHRLKGSGGSYGFHDVSKLGETIQYLPDPAEWNEVETLFHRLEEMYERIAEGL